jgi:hypothetical protein
MLVEIERIRKARVAQGVERKLARFLGKQTLKRFRSTVETKNDSRAASAEALDIENPVGVTKPELRAKRAPNLNRRGAEGNRERVRQVATARALPTHLDRGEHAVERPQSVRPAAKAPTVTETDMDILKQQYGWQDI